MNERILIVEDNPLHMKPMEMALRDKNYTLPKATDGEEALNVATSQQADLILIGIRLPKMDGFQVTKKLREGVIKSGCDAYLSKPIDTHELL